MLTGGVLGEKPTWPHKQVLFRSAAREKILQGAAWLGRGDYTAGDWPSMREEAARSRNERTALYLLGMPLLSDYLEERLIGFNVQSVLRPSAQRG